MPPRSKPKFRPKSYNDKCEQLVFRRKAKVYARRFYRIGFILTVIIVLFITTCWIKRQTMVDTFYQLTAETGLKFEHVSITGNKFSGEDELAIRLGLTDDKIGTPILAYNLEDLRKNVMKQPWVKNAQVQRVLPSNLKITIEERKPIAIWQLGKHYSLIDSDGVVLTDVDSPDVLPFPLIIGAGANKEAARIFAVLGHEKRLYEQVQSAVLMGERRWNVLFNNGIEVMLPADNMAEAWTKLATMDQQEHILSRQIKSIDLRLPDRVYIKTIDGDVVKTSMRSKNA